VEVLNGNKIGLAIFQLLRTDQRLTFRTVPIATTVVGNALMAAVVALLNMAAESGGTATLDRAHDAALPTAEGLGVLLAVGRTGLAKDVRHLEPGGMHHAPQQWAGGAGSIPGSSIRGKQSKGLVVAHTVVVATFR
jgi:hypothetical protein